LGTAVDFPRGPAEVATARFPKRIQFVQSVRKNANRFEISRGPPKAVPRFPCPRAPAGL